MIDATKTIIRARRKLGAPIIDVELTDEQMTSLLKDAHETFYLYADMADMSREKFCNIEDAWVKKYFYALCKETLGRVRGKYGGILPIPTTDLKIDFESLLAESVREKCFLKYAIFGEKELLKCNQVENAILVIYMNTGNLEHKDVEDFLDGIRKKFGHIPGFTTFFLPIRGESRIECIHPNSVELNEEGKGVINRLNKYLNDLTNKVDSIIGTKVSLDLGGIGPAQLTIVEIEETLNIISLKYDISGKTIELTIEDFESLSGTKINKNEQ